METIPRGKYDRSKVKKQPYSTGTSRVVDWYDFFYNWYDLYNCNKEKALIAYKLYSKEKSNGTPSSLFSVHKNQHKEEFEQARKDYFESVGVTEDSIILRVNDIANNCLTRPMVQLEALKFLYQIMTTTKVADIQSQAQSIIVKFEEPKVIEDTGNENQ